MKKIKIYGKENCGLCNSAKQKLNMMGLTYEDALLEDYIRPHDGWETDESVEVLSAYSMIAKIPLIRIDDEYMDYPHAMKAIKKRSS